MSVRIERRDCPVHGAVDALVTYEDGPAGPGHVPIMFECPRCTSQRERRRIEWNQAVTNRAGQ